MLTGAVHGGGSGGDLPACSAAAGPESPSTEHDPPRDNLRRRLRERGVSQAAASLAIEQGVSPAISFARHAPTPYSCSALRLSGGFEVSRIEPLGGTDPPTLG